MPFELSIAGVLIPGVLVWFVISLLVLWLLDTLAGRFGLYRHAWHPALFRIAVFVCFFCGFGLLLF